MTIASIESPALDDGTKLLGSQLRSLRDTLTRGIVSDTDNYTILNVNSNKMFVLGAATAADKTVKFPDVGATDDGFIAIVLNDSDYEMTVKPYDENDYMQGTGNGYGWTATQKGCFGAWRYNFADTTWYPILPMGGGNWVVEGLKVWVPCTEITIFDPDTIATLNMVTEKTLKHQVYLRNGGRIQTSGFYSKSIELNNIDEYMDAPDSADWDVMSSLSDDQCIIARVRFGSLGTNEFIAAQVEAATDEWFFFKGGTDELNFFFETSLGTGVGLTCDTALSATTWYTVMVAKIAGEIGVYFGTGNTLSQDGYDNTVWTVDSFTAALEIGLRGGLYFEGRMNDIIIINQNLFNAAPNVGKTDTVTIPTDFNFVTGGD